MAEILVFYWPGGLAAPGLVRGELGGLRVRGVYRPWAGVLAGLLPGGFGRLMRWCLALSWSLGAFHWQGVRPMEGGESDLA